MDVVANCVLRAVGATLCQDSPEDISNGLQVPRRERLRLGGRFVWLTREAETAPQGVDEMETHASCTPS